MPYSEQFGYIPKDYIVFIADGGAVRFNIPRKWPQPAKPTDVGLTFTDRNEDCLLEFSYRRLNPNDITLTPLRRKMEQAVYEAYPDVDEVKVSDFDRDDMEIAMTAFEFDDPKKNRRGIANWCMASNGIFYAFITMYYWPEHVQRFEPVFAEVVRSLVLGDGTRTQLLKGSHRPMDDD